MRISDWSSDVCSSDLDGNVHGVGFILDDLEAGNALDVFGAVTDIAQVDLAVFRGPDKVGAAAVYLLDHRKARAARAAVVFRRQADAVADAIADQGGAARGERGHQDLAFAGGRHGFVDHFKHAGQGVYVKGTLRPLPKKGGAFR